MENSLLGGDSGNRTRIQDSIAVVQLKHDGGSEDVISSLRIGARMRVGGLCG